MSWGDNSGTAGHHHQQQLLFNQATSTSLRKEVNSRNNLCWWPWLMHPQFYLQPPFQATGPHDYPRGKSLQGSLCTGYQTSSGTATLINSTPLLKWLKVIVSKSFGLNAITQLSAPISAAAPCSACLLYIYPVAHCCLLTWHIPMMKMTEFSIAKVQIMIEVKTSRKAGPTSSAVLHKHKPIRTLPWTEMWCSTTEEVFPAQGSECPL